jgi:hypothetical protein
MQQDTSAIAAARLRLAIAGDLLDRSRELMDSGDLLLARTLLYDYMFAVIDAKESLSQCDNATLHDTVNESLQRGSHLPGLAR